MPASAKPSAFRSCATALVGANPDHTVPGPLMRLAHRRQRIALARAGPALDQLQPAGDTACANAARWSSRNVRDASAASWCRGATPR